MCASGRLDVVRWWYREGPPVKGTVTCDPRESEVVCMVTLGVSERPIMRSEVCGAYTVHAKAWRNGCGFRMGVTVGLRDVSQPERPYLAPADFESLSSSTVLSGEAG